MVTQGMKCAEELPQEQQEQQEKAHSRNSTPVLYVITLGLKTIIKENNVGQCI